MTAQPGTEVVSHNCGFTRPTVAEAVLVILLGLTAKTALDHVFVGVPTFADFSKMWDALWMNKARNFLVFAQLTVFFFTMFRFYLGSLRYHQARQKYKKLFPLLFDMVGSTIIFVGFYLAALAVKSTQNFYAFVALLHALDLFWFIGAWLSYPVPPETEKVIRSFVWFDLFTLGVFGIIFWVFGFADAAPFLGQWCGLVVLASVGVFDFVWNSRFFRGESQAI